MALRRSHPTFLTSGESPASPLVRVGGTRIMRKRRRLCMRSKTASHTQALTAFSALRQVGDFSSSAPKR